MTDPVTSNQLADALSPYLLQHRDQPVHWQAWHRDSLALARRLDRPILLSIGYSACHWCHVMAEESFDDPTIAALMNAYFVNIKVDREERPDLDRIYQLAHQLLTGRGGGWPLTVFLDPETQAPFFAGTYYPPEPRHGVPGLGVLLQRIHSIWTTRRDELRHQQRQVHQALKAISQPRDGTERADPDDLSEQLLSLLTSRFDARHGGFGSAPKFPQPPVLDFLSQRANDEQADQMLSDTLEAIIRFGLRDHLGGGFFRYATDAAWEIPHFEKMLSDNALLLDLLVRAAVRWPHRDFRHAAEQLVSWLLRDMTLEGGGFASSLDADNDAGEGAYYLWTPEQLTHALDPSLRELAAEAFGLDGPPNVEPPDAPGEDEPDETPDNQAAWHLIRARDNQELQDHDREDRPLEARLDLIRAQMLDYRQARPALHRDDKLIGSWNGLMIDALARGGRLLRQPEWQAQAAQALDAVAVRLFGNEPPYSVWRATGPIDAQRGIGAQFANLDDHANVLMACLEMLSWRFDPRWFNLARRLGRRIQQHFVDPETGACFFTSDEQTDLLTRPLALADDATPAGAARAAEGLARLGHLCGESALLATADWIIQGAGGDMNSSPQGHAGMITAALRLRTPRPQILIGGPGDEPAQWLEMIGNRADVYAYRVPPDAALENPPALLERIQGFDQAAAVVCAGTRCLAPVFSMDALNESLASLGD